MKKIGAFILTAVLLLSLTACGGNGGKENSAIESKGLFVFSPKESFDLSKEESLSENEAYLIHVYDILPDSKKNADMSAIPDDYTVKLNDTNTYESVTPPAGAAMKSFLYAAHYAADTSIQTILAGSEPIRAVSVFRVNKQDISDQTTVKFSIQGSGIYNTSMSFGPEDIVTIDMLDKIFHIEEDPSQYQLASTMLWRSQGIKNAVNFLSSNGGLNNDVAVVSALAALEVNTMLNMSAGLDSNSNVVYYDFNEDSLLLSEETIEAAEESKLAAEEIISAVNSVYPEISDTTTTLFDAKAIFEENLRLCSDPSTYTEEALLQLNLAMGEIDSSVNEIFDYFTK